MGRQQVLHGIGNDIVNELVRSLDPHFKSGGLSLSISYTITNQGVIQIHMNPRWKYLEYGTPGAKAGQSSTVGPFTMSFGPKPGRKMPVYKENGVFKSYITGKEGDFALSKHIQQYGTKPHPFVRPVLYHKLQGIVQENIRRHHVGVS